MFLLLCTLRRPPDPAPTPTPSAPPPSRSPFSFSSLLPSISSITKLNTRERGSYLSISFNPALSGFSALLFLGVHYLYCVCTKEAPDGQNQMSKPGED